MLASRAVAAMLDDAVFIYVDRVRVSVRSQRRRSPGRPAELGFVARKGAAVRHVRNVVR
jgi:hypothetical protein